jgi:DnaJ domain
MTDSYLHTVTHAYAALGLTPAATLVEVRNAYRRAAMRWHPDRPGGNVAKFQEMKEAYELIESGKADLATRLPWAHKTNQTGFGYVDAMTPEYMTMKMQYPDIDDTCAVCGGAGRVNVAVGKIGWRSMPCPKLNCTAVKRETK